MYLTVELLLVTERKTKLKIQVCMLLSCHKKLPDCVWFQSYSVKCVLLFHAWVFGDVITSEYLKSENLFHERKKLSKLIKKHFPCFTSTLF